MRDKIMTQLLQFKEGSNAKLPADNILVTDPCYVFGHMEEVSWDDFCDGLFATEQTNGACILTYKGIEILVCNTAHGDGEYSAYASGQKGTFGVDAGLFCFIPYSEAAEKAPELLPFFGADILENGDISFMPSCACVLNARSGIVKAVETGIVEGVINIDTEDNFDEEEDIFDYDDEEDSDWDSEDFDDDF
jgi:hypothetical protein